MIKLIKPSIEHKDMYKSIIEEWQQFGGPYAPCIVDYDCSNPIDGLDYDATIKVVDDYSKGNIFDYDVDYFEKSDFYFIFDNNDLIGVGEVRHNLKQLGKQLMGHIVCGIRPSKRNKGYALESIKYMVDNLKEDGIDEVILCHYSENEIIPEIITKLDFKFRNSVISEAVNKEIKCYTKKLK